MLVTEKMKPASPSLSTLVVNRLSNMQDAGPNACSSYFNGNPAQLAHVRWTARLSDSSEMQPTPSLPRVSKVSCRFSRRGLTTSYGVVLVAVVTTSRLGKTLSRIDSPISTPYVYEFPSLDSKRGVCLRLTLTFKSGLWSKCSWCIRAAGAGPVELRR